MGIHKQLAKVIIAEHAHRPITGRVLLIGRQTVAPSETEVRDYLREFGIPARAISVDEDRDTRFADDGGISDRSFFSLFTDASFSALDVTDYEKADIIHNMNEPIPDHLKGRFDFIYNGSCLDNVFNSAAFLQNCSELLSPGGRILHVEHGSLWRGAYVMYSGDWFHDYYAANDFEDCKVFYAKFFFNHHRERWRISQASPLEKDGSWVSSIWPHLILCIAEKGPASTAHKSPIQAQYRPADQAELYHRAAERFAAKVRYPKAFGAPTQHRRKLKRLVRSARSMIRTRSNLRPVQDV